VYIHVLQERRTYGLRRATLRWSFSAFSGVMIASTPGIAFAPARSKPMIAPAPMVLCTSTACTTSGTLNSAA
jgi:hypothetical protein